MINDLLGAGMTQQEIATSIGASQPQVSALLHRTRGKRLSYEIAIALIQLHGRVCGKTQSSLLAAPAA